VNSFNQEYFIHGANVLLLLAYSVRDILWLRLFALASSLIAIPYFVLQPTPLLPAVGWSTLFVAINSPARLRRFATSESVGGSGHRVMDHSRDRRASDRARRMYRRCVARCPRESAG
jgi:hypothetical protein